MLFLEEEDFKSQIKGDILDKIMENNHSVLFDGERKAVSEIQSYLRARFDVAQIFNKIGNDRNALIIMYCVDILLYHIHSRLNPRQIPELRGIRYEAAIKWLQDVSKGVLTPDLPGYTGDESEKNSTMRWGSEIRRNLKI